MYIPSCFFRTINLFYFIPFYLLIFPFCLTLQSDQIGLTVNSETASAPSLYADNPNRFGMPFNSKKSIENKNIENLENFESIEKATGHVYVGLAEINKLEIAADIRQHRGAEAGVFDPALIKILAKNYSLDGNCNDTFSSIIHNNYSYGSNVEKACRINLAVAMSAGLKCRSAVWSTVLTLLPKKMKNNFNFNPDFCSSSSNLSLKSVHTSTIASNVQSTITYSVVGDKDNNNNIHNINNNHNHNINDDNINNINCSSNEEEQIPFASELLGDLLLELLEGGDCQHFTVLCEILRRAGLLESATLSAGISKVRA